MTDATIATTLILMTSRRAGEGERLLRAGRWKGWEPNQLLGFHVDGKTLGMVGMAGSARRSPAAPRPSG